MGDMQEQMMMQRACTHLSDVVLYMPMATKAAYLEALIQCPHLVESESNPETFLRFEDFNYWSAAGRLVTYWRKRKEFFGDRAFLPMDLSGKGAMNDDDIRPMATGSLTMIPNSNIIIHDRTCASDAGDEATKMRRRFFFMQTMMNSTLHTEKGPRLFIYGFEISDARKRMNAQLKSLIASAFPIPNFEEFHLIFVKEKNQTIWQYILPRGLEQMSGLIGNVMIHNFNFKDEIADQLSYYGVTRSHLPVKLGGCYSPEQSLFVLQCGLPLSTIYRLNQPAPASYESPIRNQSATEKGSLERLLEFFMKKAPDLPDVEEMDSLDPLTPSDLASITNQKSDSCYYYSRSIPLYVDYDTKVLSAYQCLARQQIEFFEASEDDITSSIRGRKKAIVLGQVGLRCRHCAHLPRQKRAIAATYYPTALEGVYQTAHNLARKHLISSCPFVPPECSRKLAELGESKSVTCIGKHYWAETAELSGVFEIDGILRFQGAPTLADT
jgi:hypothetical protein